MEPPRPGSDLSARLCNVVAQLRAQHPSQPPCFVVVQGVPCTVAWAASVLVGMWTRARARVGGFLAAQPRTTRILCCYLLCTDSKLDAGTAPEQHILPSFVEDGIPGLIAYRDWLFQLHKQVLVKS